MIEINELNFDGEIIVPAHHYESIRNSKFERTIRKMLVGEKRLTKSKPKRTKLDLSNWSNIFQGLKDKSIHVVIECEDLKEPTFTIGAVAKVKKKSVEVWNFDATGKIDKKTTKIKFQDITLLRFNDEYSTTFRKYLKGKKNRM